MSDAGAFEEVEIHGHIIDSLLLPKVLDVILTRGGSYVIKDIKIGQRGTDPSHARVEVRAPTANRLHEILNIIHDHGAIPVHVADCETVPADVAGAFPEGFYCSSNFRTQVRLGGERDACLLRGGAREQERRFCRGGVRRSRRRCWGLRGRCRSGDLLRGAASAAGPG